MTLEEAIRASGRGFGNALCEAWEQAKAEFTEQEIYAFCVRTINLFDGFACVVNTREHHRWNLDNPDQNLLSYSSDALPIERLVRLAEVQAGTWITRATSLEAFEQVNAQVRLPEQRDDYDDGVLVLDLHAIWGEILLQAFEQLKRQAPAEDGIEDKLLGYQQPSGPSHLDWNLAIKLSEALNAPRWTEQLKEARITDYELGVQLAGKEATDREMGPRVFVPPLPSQGLPSDRDRLGAKWQLVFLSEEPAPFDAPLDVVLEKGAFRASGRGVTMSGRYDLLDKTFTVEADVTREATEGVAPDWTAARLDGYSHTWPIGDEIQIYSSLDTDPPRAMLFELRYVGPLD